MRPCDRGRRLRPYASLLIFDNEDYPVKTIRKNLAQLHKESQKLKLSVTSSSLNNLEEVQAFIAQASTLSNQASRLISQLLRDARLLEQDNIELRSQNMLLTTECDALRFQLTDLEKSLAKK